MAFEPTDFQAKVAHNATYYYGIAKNQFFTDFNPLTVDWTTPVPWGNEPTKCNMEGDDSGCLMPNGAGLCVANSHRVLPPPTLDRPSPPRARSAQCHHLWLRRLFLGCDLCPDHGTARALQRGPFLRTNAPALTALSPLVCSSSPSSPTSR